MDLLKIGLVSDKVDAFTLRDAADWTLKPRLLAVPGVAHVIVFGGAQRQIQVRPDPRRLVSYGFTLADVAEAVRAALPLRGSGFIDLPGQRVLLRSPTRSPTLPFCGRRRWACATACPCASPTSPRSDSCPRYARATRS